MKKLLMIATMMVAVACQQAPTTPTTPTPPPVVSEMPTPPPVVSEMPTLRKGSTETEAVKVLQGYLGIEQDGVFGSGTEAAVKAFQTKAGLSADGVVGKATWAALKTGIGNEPAPQPTPVPAPTGSCETEAFTAQTSNQGGVVFPASGHFVLESHLASKDDSFPGGRLFPSTSTENIQAHLTNSCFVLKSISKTIECSSVYSSKYHKEWTPPEGGKAGQGSVGDLKPSLREEMFIVNMMWASGKKPAAGTRFLASFNGKNVVVVAGYETGPGDSKWLGGFQGEVFYFLGAKPSYWQTSASQIAGDKITIAKLKDQAALPGPITCK